MDFWDWNGVCQGKGQLHADSVYCLFPNNYRYSIVPLNKNENSSICSKALWESCSAASFFKNFLHLFMSLNFVELALLSGMGPGGHTNPSDWQRAPFPCWAFLPGPCDTFSKMVFIPCIILFRLNVTKYLWVSKMEFFYILFLNKVCILGKNTISWTLLECIDKWMLIVSC